MSTVSEENKAAAAAIKAKANEAFKNKDFIAAAKLYGEALEKNDQDATIWCNRAFARMNLEEFGYALDDCTKAIERDPRYVKAYYRRALCYLSILKNPQAIADFKKTLALDPQNAVAKKQLEATQKLQRRIEFEKAIEQDEEETAVERVMEAIRSGLDIESSYAGPRLPPASEEAAAKGKKYGINEEFITKMEEWFKAGKTLAKRVVYEIVLGCWDACLQEESLNEIVLEEGMTCDVIGDTHGQYYDLLHLLSLTGKPSKTHCLLFNGDFVDRGSWSVEVALTVMAWKWLFPNTVLLNRGNHETNDMNKVYGFEGEVKHKHGELAYKLFAHVFTALPLATLVSPALPPSPKALAGAVGKGQAPILSKEGRMRYFVTHGGLFSKDNITLDDIRAIPRIGKQPGNEGLMCELLWTDPQETPGRGPSKRGVGIGFGPDVTKNWCKLNGITGVLRSHEVRQGGYAIEHDGLCTTVFSAPNYVDQTGNKGAFVRIDAHGTREYTTYEAVPHPPMRPMAYAGAMGMF
ncbi:Serine/threonine-protein phosphatase T Short=PPT [Serendipita indica DSM 11827]|nr:Serine/threonine-protein phosphatase T Short=PPT [Serendipita indica DSM 11827]